MKKFRRSFERFCLRNQNKGIPNLMLYICIGNAVAKLTQPVESNKIGLKTCEKILSQMNGRLLRHVEAGKFSAEVVLPRTDADAPENS